MDTTRIEGQSPSFGVEIIRKTIWLLIMTICMAYLVMYTVLPTQAYGRFYIKNLLKLSSSTFFGNQVGTLLMFTCPILFVASLSCAYLHLGSKIHHNIQFGSNGKKISGVKAFWKRPMLVKGPLGIVSGTELAFFLMFISLLAWYLYVHLRNQLRGFNPAAAAVFNMNVWQHKLETLGVYFGIAGNAGLVLLFFPVSRRSSVLSFFGLTPERSIMYHIWMGHIVVILFTAHGLSYIIIWASSHQWSKMIKWNKRPTLSLPGEISLLAGLVLWLTTFPRTRKRMFELFFYTHHLYIVFVLFFIFHVGITYSYMMLPGFYLFLIDRYLRFLQSRQRIAVVSARILPDALELNFSKDPGLKYNPTSIVFLNISSISKLQWHPFSISSSSNLDKHNLSVLIKNEGSWTHRLHEMVSSSPPIEHLDVAIEGPYGPTSTHFLRYDTLVMVSGGSGIAPFISIIREFIFISTRLNCNTPQIMLICAFKNSFDLTMLDLILPNSETPINLSNMQLQIMAYVTREHEPNMDLTNTMRTLWLKPNPTDVPFSTILGSNSWLWLAAIILVSFVMFLTLVGIITHYYIYKHYSSTSQAVINLLVMCGCIAIVASIVVLWIKQQNSKEAKRMQNMERTAQEHSFDSWLEREVESLPHQSLMQAANIQYGQRPNLKRLLLDCKGSNTGVLVCGLKKMREQVATICSSGLANNLKFESISFSW